MVSAHMSRAHHVAVSIKGLYTSKKLLIITEGDEDLGVIADRLLEDGEGSLVNFMLLELADLGLVKVGLWLVLVLAVRTRQYLFSQTEMGPRASWWSEEWPEPNISENSVSISAGAGLAVRCCLDALYDISKHFSITGPSTGVQLVNLCVFGNSL